LTGGTVPAPDEQAITKLAHELKNPLAVIQGYAELLRLRDDDRTRAEAAARIHEAAEQLGHVVDDLLAFLAD
jgi:signal transduction histidine kinase